MLERLVHVSIRFRNAVIVFLFALLAAGGWAVSTLPIDALPDVSTIQVSVLTTASGLTPLEIERTVTTPIENALNGVPGSAELRSVSRSGLSAVTVVFVDGTNVWFARQLVLERLRGVELPPSAATPELAPVSTGLGEIYQFVVRSDQHSAMQLRTLLDWEIVPRLRSVPGVIEVNTMGGELKQFQIVVDRQKLRAYRLSVGDVATAIKAANLNVGGGYVERLEEAFNVRGQGVFESESDIGDVVLRTDAEGTPVLVRQVADIRVSPALQHGVVTHGGKGEAVTGIVMMLLGANSRDVVHAVGQRVEEVRKVLPPGVHIDVIYDRADFVGRTIRTVMTNLAEGILIVTVVLVLFLGTLRGALVVVLGIPASMAVALIGMRFFGVTGDLMSLGAIDFGFLVDGPIVVLEAVVAATAGRVLRGPLRARAYERVASAVARPVAFAVAIILLVYVPLLALEGVEGKMFKPMALTMACALAGALIYAVVFFPALLSAFVPPLPHHGPRFMDWIATQYSRALPRFVALRWTLLTGSVALLAAVSFLFVKSGAEFVPRIFEGDAVVTIRRAPSISLKEARRLDLETEQVLHTYPEVMTSLGMTGRAEVATDPVGNDNTDILVRLQPIKTWTTAHDFDDLSEILKRDIVQKVSGTFVSVSQPIEDRTNELISGSRADVQIQLLGSDLNDLTRLSKEIARVVRTIQGSGDVRVERILGQPLISAVVDRHRMARYGVKAEDALMVIQAAREGVRVGELYEVQRRFDIRVLYPPWAPSAAAMGELFVETSNGEGIPLREVATLSEGDGPVAIRRQNRERAVRVDVNLRGRDLVSWVAEAQQRVRAHVRLPGDYRIEWGGQFENFERASARLAVVVPVVVGIIFGMLLWMFQNMRFALAVFALVPLSLMGGMAGLLMRGLAFSLPAAIGFIALGGIGVLNGVVVANEVRRRMLDGEATDSAIVRGFAAVVRAILTTAAVAALGFLPMAIATGAGAEVQRPLATAVVIGMAFGTALSLAVLPGVLTIALRGYIPEDESGEDWAPGTDSPPPSTKVGAGSPVSDAAAST
jgi:cobalt-zinc-cadmium resistance protein CzcA